MSFTSAMRFGMLPAGYLDDTISSILDCANPPLSGKSVPSNASPMRRDASLSLAAASLSFLILSSSSGTSIAGARTKTYFPGTGTFCPCVAYGQTVHLLLNSVASPSRVVFITGAMGLPQTGQT